MILASQYGHEDIVDFLLSLEDIDVNLKIYGRMALGEAEGHKNIIEKLLEAGADPYMLEDV